MLYRDLFNKRKRKLFRYTSWLLSIFLVLGIVITLLFLKKDSNLFVILIVVDLILFTTLIFLWGWLCESSKVNELKNYINNRTNMFSILFEAYINNNIIKALSIKNLKVSGYYANINKGNPEFWIWYNQRKKQFLVEVKGNAIKYFYGDIKIEEQDIEDEEWIEIKIDGLGFKSIEEIAYFIKDLYLDELQKYYSFLI